MKFIRLIYHLFLLFTVPVALFIVIPAIRRGIFEYNITYSKIKKEDNDVNNNT